MKDHHAVRQDAAAALSRAAYSPRKLVLIHGGAAMAMTVLLTVVSFLITHQIDASGGGLSGMGLRTTLSTLRSVLQFAVTVLMPFWNIGFVYAAMKQAREQNAVPGDLPEGFRRFGSVLSLLLLQGLGGGILAMLCMNISMGIFVVSPFYLSLAKELEPFMESAAAGGQITDEILGIAARGALPAIIIFAVLYLAVIIPVLYHLRMAEFIVMDSGRTGGFRAVVESFRMMRRSCLKLFRLDLSFWWYYLLQGLVMLIGYADVLLPVMNIELPISADAAYFLFYGIYVAAGLGLMVWMKPRMAVSYAVFYDSLAEERAPRQAPGNLPWKG